MHFNNKAKIHLNEFNMRLVNIFFKKNDLENFIQGINV